MVTMSASASIAAIDSADSDISDSPQAVRQRLYSVACELFLLVSCFVFAIYSTRMEPRRHAHPAATSPAAQQTKSPNRVMPPGSVPPAQPVGKTLAHLG